jgi:hypothetical protein
MHEQYHVGSRRSTKEDISEQFSEYGIVTQARQRYKVGAILKQRKKGT